MKMQPLAYLAVRVVLGWLQLVQRADRAFVGDPLVLVAAGAVHCWAVVYSLFVAVHTRAMRYDGYHEGYVEHLPGSVAWTETLAMASLWVWLLAGFTTAAVRLLDEDAGNLPMGLEDAKGSPITKLIRSPMFHSLLGHAHSVSCVGLFLSILMLCFTMALMKGGITACELCLVIVSIGFAVPHALLAARRLSGAAERALEELLPPQAAEAAAAEAAAMGPQLCIVLALADAPGHAYLWQNCVYCLASIALLAAVAGSARYPPKTVGAALPPEVHESLVCLVLDAVAALAIVLSYPHLNTWLTWASALGVLGVAASCRMQAVREVYEDWLEPVLVVRSDTHKRMPSPQRQLLRKNSWVLGLLCAATTLWDITWHPVPQYSYPMVNQAILMLRWQSPTETKTSSQMLSIAASSLGLTERSFEVETTLPSHRLLLFKYTGREDPANQTTPMFLNWQATMLAPKGELAEIVDSSFPAALNVSMCAEMQEATTNDKDSASNSTKREAREAYVAACDYWKDRVVKSSMEILAGQS